MQAEGHACHQRGAASCSSPASRPFVPSKPASRTSATPHASQALTSISMKCAPCSPALSCRYSGLRSATSSAASRCDSCVSAGRQSREAKRKAVARRQAAGEGADGITLAVLQGAGHPTGSPAAPAAARPRRLPSAAHLHRWCPRSCCLQCTPGTPARRVEDAAGAQRW